MPRPSKRAQQTKRARDTKAILHAFDQRCMAVALQNAKRFAFSIIVTGSNYSAVSELLLWNDIIPPSQRTFNRAQIEVTNLIIQMARESCAKYKALMKPHSCISMDGSWAHRRNASNCVLDFFDQSQKKIVDFEFSTKDNHSITGDYTGSSNGMEIDCLRKMATRWIGNPNVEFYSHDGDGKTHNVMREIGWEIKELNDINHTLKSFKRKFEAFNKATKSLHGLKGRLFSFLKDLIYCDNLSLEEKENHWMNAANHFMGDHSQCLPHGPSKEWAGASKEHSRELLEIFLSKTLKILQKVRKNLTTQLNESFHAIKAKYANKDFLWLSSWNGRVAAAVLQFNSPNIWKFELYKKLGFEPLSKAATEELMRKFRIAEEYSNRRRTEEYQKAEARRRNIKHLKSIKIKDGRDLYQDKKAKKEELKQFISDIPNFVESQVDFEIRVSSYNREEISEDNCAAVDLQEYQELICSGIQPEDLLPFFDINYGL